MCENRKIIQSGEILRFSSMRYRRTAYFCSRSKTTEQMLTKINCAKCIGTEAVPVTVEVDISPGIGIHLTGMPDTAIKESIMRVSTAMRAEGFRIPGHRIVINLAPGDIRKSGTGYDAAIALGMIFSSQQAPMGRVSEYIILGELALDGSLRTVPGGLPVAQLASANGFKGVILPKGPAMEAIAIESIEVLYADKLSDILHIVSEDRYRLAFNARNIACRAGCEDTRNGRMADAIPDMCEIVGQHSAKRAVEIAAGGGHDILMIGTPGSGKSTLAKAVQGIMPPLSKDEAIETGKIYSVSGIAMPPEGRRPFRAPDRNITMASLIGGGRNALPGEISLAHNGVLFIDEATEIRKRVLDALKEPMENKEIIISRLYHRIRYPACFMLILAANPCPCGYYGEKGRCRCSDNAIERHLGKLSGPLMDRIDLRVYMPPVSGKSLAFTQGEEDSAHIALRVGTARDRQKERFYGQRIRLNSMMDMEDVRKHCIAGVKEASYCQKTVDRLGLSARGFLRILRMARTIADLDNEDLVREEHIAQAVSYRKAGNVL